MRTGAANTQMVALDQMATGLAGGDQEMAAGLVGDERRTDSVPKREDGGVLEDRNLTRNAIEGSASSGEVGTGRGSSAPASMASTARWSEKTDLSGSIQGASGRFLGCAGSSRHGGARRHCGEAQGGLHRWQIGDNRGSISG